MKGLKATLIAIYAALILLLLLGLCSRKKQTERFVHVDTIDRVIVDTVREDPGLPPVRERFSADVVMCIDASGSMAPILNTVKNNAMNFYGDLKRESRRHGKDITSIRVRVVAFRDFHQLVSGPAFEQSPFYTLPAGDKDLKNFVGALRPFDGGDLPELGLDAIAMAVKSDWSDKADTKRVIILWTDADTKDLFNKAHHGIDGFRELTEIWNKDFAAKGRMFLFTPNVPFWRTAESAFKNCVSHNVSAGGGLSDLDYKEILEAISEDI